MHPTGSCCRPQGRRPRRQRPLPRIRRQLRLCLEDPAGDTVGPRRCLLPLTRAGDVRFAGLRRRDVSRSFRSFWLYGLLLREGTRETIPQRLARGPEANHAFSAARRSRRPIRVPSIAAAVRHRAAGCRPGLLPPDPGVSRSRRSASGAIGGRVGIGYLAEKNRQTGFRLSPHRLSMAAIPSHPAGAVVPSPLHRFFPIRPPKNRDLHACQGLCATAPAAGCCGSVRRSIAGNPGRQGAGKPVPDADETVAIAGTEGDSPRRFRPQRSWLSRSFPSAACRKRSAACLNRSSALPLAPRLLACFATRSPDASPARSSPIRSG